MVSDGFAASCTDIFPATQSFAVDGSSDIDGSTTCNGGGCSSPPGFTIPSLPGVSPSGVFNLNTVSAGEYYHTDWGLGDGETVTFSGAGTAVIYFTGNVTIGKESDINVAGSPDNLVLIIFGDLEIEKEVEINALIYVDGNADIEKEVVMSGALSVKGNLDVAKDTVFNHDPADVNAADISSFCTGTPAGPVDHYEIVHDGAGSTCGSESITVRACLDAGCATLSGDNLSMNVMIDGVAEVAVSFVGSTTATINHNIAETVTLSLGGHSVIPDNPLVCDDGSSSSCDMVFSTAGCPTCDSFFADTVQGNAPGSELILGDSARILGDPDNVLTFPTIDDNASGNSCGTSDCSASGAQSMALAPPAFQTTGTSTDVSISSGTETIGPGGTEPYTEINDLDISGGTVTFQATATEYRVTSASFTGSPTITFNPGEYWFDFLEILDSTQIIINGPVTIYVQDHFDIEDDSQINVAGAARDLVMFGFDKMHVKNNVVINAVFYNVGGEEIELQDDVVFTGAISGSGDVELKNDAVLNYADISGVAVGSLCTPAPQYVVDHYEIIHDGSGLTCEAESITVRACEDTACSTLASVSTTLDFLADGVTQGSPTFTGSTSVSLSETTPVTRTLSIANPDQTPINPLVCSDGTGSSCDITFTDAGFVFLYGAANATTVADQVAGDLFADVLKLRAVENVDGVCTGLFTGVVSVELAQQSITPGAVSSLEFSVNGTPIGKNPVASVTNYTNVSLNFGGASTADILQPLYQDAGQIRLHARYDVGGVNLSGSSNALWVSPDALVLGALDGATVLDATSATDTPVLGAGEAFTLSVTAVNSAGSVTPNYQPGQIRMRVERTGPVGAGIDGALTYATGLALGASTTPMFQNVTLTSFSTGESTFSAANYDEVGLINIDVEDSDYGGVGIVVPATAIDVGRFTPTGFTVAVDNAGSFEGACSITANPYTYAGQSFGYDVTPAFSVVPHGATGNVQNYVGAFMHLTSNEFTLVFPSADGNGLGVTSSGNAGVLTEDGDGTLTYTLNMLDGYTYEKSGVTPVGPFDSDLSITVSTINETQDGVGGTGLPVSLTPVGEEIRFGRLAFSNSFGPETRDLPMQLEVQYLDSGGNYIVNPDDFCTTITSLTTSPDSSPSGSHTNIPVGAGVSDLLANPPVSAGVANLIFGAPGAGNRGDITVTVDLGSEEYLQFDWDLDSSLEDSLSRTVTFGQYRGHDRIIYWSEL